MEFSGKNSSENLYSSLIFLHAARFLTQLIGVQSVVDSSWKALICNVEKAIVSFLN